MAEQRIDFTACIVSGGIELLERINSVREEYSPLCGEYFDYLSCKSGKPTFTRSACGFILLDGLFRKNGIDRSGLVIVRDPDGRPCIVNRSDVDFSISHSEGAAMACLAVGENARVGADIQRVRNYSREHLESLARSFMDETELREFLSAEDRERYFYTLWTRREAYYKRCGSYDGFGGDQRCDTGTITACGRLYYYSISRQDED